MTIKIMGNYGEQAAFVQNPDEENISELKSNNSIEKYSD